MPLCDRKIISTATLAIVRRRPWLETKIGFIAVTPFRGYIWYRPMEGKTGDRTTALQNRYNKRLKLYLNERSITGEIIMANFLFLLKSFCYETEYKFLRE
jgi:hypothetical protein